MNNENLFIRTGDLRVEPYEIAELLDVEITQEVNKHAKLYIKGILSDKTKDTYAELQTAGTNVKLSVVTKDGEKDTLIQAIVEDLEIKAEQNTYLIDIHAISHSFSLDVKIKNRSFQDKNAEYSERVQQITSEYPGGAVIDVVSNGAAVNQFIMQHEETDWQHLKRLASHFNTGLVCDVRFDSPKYYFGVPEIQTIELDTSDYTAKKDVRRFRELSQNGVGDLKENDFIYYEVVTENILGIGDTVTLNGKELRVAEIRSKAISGLLKHHLTLLPKRGLSQPYIPNTKVTGSSYSGHISEIKNDQVKVTLDTDSGHDPGKPCWFPYSTIYSSQDGSGWYTMPEIGDTARLHFPDGDDSHSYVISSVHEHVDAGLLQASGGGNNMRAPDGPCGEYEGMRDDPEVKSLRNKYGKEIRLTPDGIYLIVDGTVVTLTDDGLLVMSENDIELKSEKNIVLCAENDVNIMGNESVDLVCTETTAVQLTDDIHMVGQEVKSN